MTMRYKLLLAYDGYDFEGWQSQLHHNTICDTLQDRFKKVFNESIVLLGSSRTDSQVHARGQVAAFNTTLAIEPTRLHKAWSNSLPPSIMIRSLQACPPDFHPQFNVHSKIYTYCLFLERPLPFIARYGWFYPFIHEVDLDFFIQTLQLFKGTHDFRSFCKLETERNTVRTIYSIKAKQYAHHKTVLIQIHGSSFLHFQIRRMIGCALDCSRRSKQDRLYIKQLLEKPGVYDRMIKAEPQGLCLQKIIYNVESSL